MTGASTHLQIAVPGPLFGSFDYRLPEGYAGPVPAAGIRVRVPFGRRRVVGVLVGVAEAPRIEAGLVKPALELLDREPVVPADVMALAQWAARYYHHPLGDVLATLLPGALRQGRPAQHRADPHWRITSAGRETDLEALSRRAPRQAELLGWLAGRADAGPGQTPEPDVDWAAPRRALADKGWIESFIPDHRPATTIEGPELHPEQRRAVDAISDALGRFQAFLLDGVTGSGKTEVYLHAIEAAVRQGLQALVLVPEIGLTPQLLDRFSARLPGRLIALHSGLSDGERMNAWLDALSGEADVIVGTRSALFAPLPRPGLIIIDEEHDLSLKQQDGFRYSARDLALVRARNLGVPIVLGSATPSVESLANAEAGRHVHLTLTERAGGARPPRFRLVDVRGQTLEAGLSHALLSELARHLELGGQSLLFLNRRGYSPVLLCHECGWLAECPRCDARLTWHQRSGRLRCHHCGHERRVPEHCPDCGNPDLKPVGQGTERLEQALRHHFPEAGVLRIDRDSTRRKGSMEDLLDRARRGQGRILLGTQMLAKGHHLPELSLVAIVDSDQGLFGADFRAPERMAQLITQVAGRAGRAERPGEVLIQTHHPEHPLLQRLLRDGYHAFAQDVLAERKAARLPPFGHVALLRAEAVAQDLPQAFLSGVRQRASELAGNTVELLGPAPSPMERRAGRYRAQLLLLAAERPPLHGLLEHLIPELPRLPDARRVRWSVDVDPQEML